MHRAKTQSTHTNIYTTYSKHTHTAHTEHTTNVHIRHTANTHTHTEHTRHTQQTHTQGHTSKLGVRSSKQPHCSRFHRSERSLVSEDRCAQAVLRQDELSTGRGAGIRARPSAPPQVVGVSQALLCAHQGEGSGRPPGPSRWAACAVANPVTHVEEAASRDRRAAGGHRGAEGRRPGRDVLPVGSGCCSKQRGRTGRLKQQTFILSGFWRLKAQDQGARKSLSSWRVRACSPGLSRCRTWRKGGGGDRGKEGQGGREREGGRGREGEEEGERVCVSEKIKIGRAHV